MPVAPAHTPLSPAPRWGVVATVREPAALVIAFACHHLALGAREVHLFFDLPHDPVAGLAESIEGVVVTRCDAAHWAALGHARPPEPQTRRQTLNANLARARVDLDWLLHADADEFLWLPDGLGAELAAMPADARWLHVPNLERCWAGPIGGEIFDGVFRADLADLPEVAAQVYGKRTQALQAGLGGHFGGKAMVRARDPEGFIAIHKLRAQEGGPELASHRAATARILHFDGITPVPWALKNLRYAAQGATVAKLLNRQRIASIGAILRARDPARAALRVHEALYRLDAAQAAGLEAAGRLMRADLDIAGAVARHAPHLAPDFSQAAFNQPLLRELDQRAQAIRRQKRRATRRGL